jgi:hypothetical protein
MADCGFTDASKTRGWVNAFFSQNIAHHSSIVSPECNVVY